MLRLCRFGVCAEKRNSTWFKRRHMIRCGKRRAVVHVSVVHARRWLVYHQKQMKGPVSFVAMAQSGVNVSKR